MGKLTGIEDTLKQCLSHIQSEKNKLKDQVITLFPDHSSQNDLLFMVEKSLKQSTVFAQLVDISAKHSGYSASHLDAPLSNFLRQSGVYHLEKFDDNSIVGKLAKVLANHLSKHKQVNITYLLSLPWVDITELELPVESDWFRLRKLSEAELSNIINNHVRDTFYPYSAIDSNSLNLLSQECWLEVYDKEEVPYPNGLTIDFSSIFGKVTYTELPLNLEKALSRLILLEWIPVGIQWGETWWPGFPLGTLVRVTDNWFEPPQKPQLKNFAFDIDGEHLIELVVQHECANIKDLEEINMKLIALEKAENASFIVNHVLRYFLKAAVRVPNNSGKSDQFIDHIVCIESLLGDKSPGFSARLAKRLGALVDRQKSKEIERMFRKLYGIRCDMLHGREISSIDTSFSWEARELTRSAIMKAIDAFYQYLSQDYHISRDDFLTMLDFLQSDKEISELGSLVKKWPIQ